jgi:hypothetical protein
MHQGLMKIATDATPSCRRLRQKSTSLAIEFLREWVRVG